jgi:hypothetical protein
MGLLFEDSLKDELVKFASIKESLANLEAQYEEYRDKIEKWMKINELESHRVQDTSGKTWDLTFESRNNRRVRDWKLLESAVGDNFEELVETGKSNFFKMKQVKR